MLFQVALAHPSVKAFTFSSTRQLAPLAAVRQFRSKGPPDLFITARSSLGGEEDCCFIKISGKELMVAFVALHMPLCLPIGKYSLEVFSETWFNGFIQIISIYRFEKGILVILFRFSISLTHFFPDLLKINSSGPLFLEV
ncbi:hypothetical protein D3A96_04235 [Robertkochia marina]|nr:hypothetical protein D3A96_04235 [Robertkochia marina]